MRRKGSFDDGVQGGGPGARSRTVEREAQQTPEAQEKAEQALADWLNEGLRRHAHNVRAERRFRLSDTIVTADFTLRQLTRVELTKAGGFADTQACDPKHRKRRYSPADDKGSADMYFTHVAL